MKILIGVDDSAHSKAALEYVKAMKWPAGTKVVVFAACAPAVSYAVVEAGVMTWTQAAEEEMTVQAQEVTARAERELRDAGLTTEARVVRGDPREAIVEAARTTGADLVVIGSHGRTGLARLLMGSVASHVVTHAPCTVMVVKPKKP
jgi:nucleotide-binding universal stress UspA family protein